jgi:hypothetical protein
MIEGRQLFSGVTIRSAGPAEEQDLFDSLMAKALEEDAADDDDDDDAADDNDADDADGDESPS